MSFVASSDVHCIKIFTRRTYPPASHLLVADQLSDASTSNVLVRFWQEVPRSAYSLVRSSESVSVVVSSPHG